MKKFYSISSVLLIVIFLNICTKGSAQTTSIVVGGDFNTFYPVMFPDVEDFNNVPTTVQIGRWNVHYDSDWRGSVLAAFTFHVNTWGHGSNFINGTVFEGMNGSPAASNFIGGWIDPTYNSGVCAIIIWLRGGNTTYYINSDDNVVPKVYDGVANALPLVITNTTYNTKSSPDAYVNTTGISSSGNAYFTGTGTNYFQGNVGIGTTNPQSLLAVNGQITAKSVQVSVSGWSDDVFKPGYKLLPLPELNAYIETKQHLPNIPQEGDVIRNGIDVSTNASLLLRKIEELTLYVIKQQKEIDELRKNQVNQNTGAKAALGETKAH